MFNVGQKVYDIKYGWGLVISIGDGTSQPVTVDFASGKKFYELDGRSYHSDKYRSLFFDKPKITDKMLNPPKWRAKKDGTYYMIGNLGGVYVQVETGGLSDDRLWDVGNYFETEEKAKESAIYKAFERVRGVND